MSAAGAGGDVASIVTIAEPALASAKTYVAYSATLSASGGSSYVWSLTSGTLPAGLTLSDTNSAQLKITGTPSEAGLFPITLSVTDGSSSAERQLTLVVTHAVLFLSDRDVAGVNELYLSALGDTTAPTPVRLNASLPNGGGVSTYAWSPDGSKVLYIAKQSAAGNPELWVASVAAPGTAKRVSAVGATVSLMSWLGAGNIAAYMTSSGDAYLVDLSGAAPGTSKLAVAAATNALKLRPSPNGTSITVGTLDPDGPGGMDLTTLTYVSWAAGAAKSVTLQAGDLGNDITYSYDGQFGTVVSPSGSQWVDLSLAAPVLTRFATLSSVSWNPKANSLLYVPVTAARSVLLGTFAGGDLASTTLVESTCTKQLPTVVWSPDGKHATFACDGNLRGISEVASAEIGGDFSLLPTGFSSEATNPNLDVVNRGWSPDGAWIAMHADRDVDSTYDLYLLRWSTPGNAFKAHAPTRAPGVTTSAFSPSSRYAALVGTIAPLTNAGLYVSRLPESGAPEPGKLISTPATAAVQDDFAWLPGSRVIAYRATISTKAQLFALPLDAAGAAGSVVPVSGMSGSGVSSYQLQPLR